MYAARKSFVCDLWGKVWDLIDRNFCFRVTTTTTGRYMNSVDFTMEVVAEEWREKVEERYID